MSIYTRNNKTKSYFRRGGQSKVGTTFTRIPDIKFILYEKFEQIDENT